MTTIRKTSAKRIAELRNKFRMESQLSPIPSWIPDYRALQRVSLEYGFRLTKVEYLKGGGIKVYNLQAPEDYEISTDKQAVMKFEKFLRWLRGSNGNGNGNGKH